MNDHWVYLSHVYTTLRARAGVTLSKVKGIATAQHETFRFCDPAMIRWCEVRTSREATDVSELVRSRRHRRSGDGVRA